MPKFKDIELPLTKPKASFKFAIVVLIALVALNMPLTEYAEELHPLKNVPVQFLIFYSSIVDGELWCPVPPRALLPCRLSC